MFLCRTTLTIAAIATTQGRGISEGGPWTTLQNVNLDIHGACGCSTSCHDVPGYHFAGSVAVAGACESTCVGAGANCSMWFWSSHSNHCWWKLGSDWEDTATVGIIAGCDPSRVPRCGLGPAPPSPPPPPPPLPPAVPCTGASSGLSPGDCAAWQDMFHAAGGPGWTEGSSGLADPCSVQWPEGAVTCADGHVISVVLPANNLTGYLPLSVSNFSVAEKFQVPYNFLGGELPLTIARMSKLTTFDITCNKFGGALPSLPFAQYIGFCGVSDHHCAEPYPTNSWRCPLPPNVGTYCPAALCTH
mmetsp:Transcript_14147/g.36519  ORF Transcript_14147/g.36519 Transcript_14147/m.36519 type:complete len:302 (-) Transcript_14147:88-993(-)